MRRAGYAFAALAWAHEKKLPESREDSARLRLADMLAALGKKDQAVAILRLGLRDPNPAGSSDREIALRIHDLLPYAEKSRWRKYLECPDLRPDPAAPAVFALHGVVPSSVVPADERLSFESPFWTVEAGLSARDPAAAEAAYEALEAAAEDEERARILVKIVDYEARRAEEASEAGERKEAQAEAEKAAKELAATSLRLVREGSSGTAHWAGIEAIKACEKARIPLAALEFAREVVAGLDPERDLAKYAYLKLYLLGLIETFDPKRPSYAELAAEARAVWELCRGNADATIENLGDSALMFTIGYLEHAGEKDAARELLEEFDARCAEKYPKHVRLFHERLDER